jgi:hypothetical protein
MYVDNFKVPSVPPAVSAALKTRLIVETRVPAEPRCWVFASRGVATASPKSLVFALAS